MNNNNEKIKEGEKEEKVFEGVVEDLDQEEKNKHDKEEKRDNKNNSETRGKSYRFQSSCCSRSSSGGGSIFGLFILFLGLFYLGKNLGWWNYQLDWNTIWPILIVLCGLSIMGGKKVVHWLIGIVLFFAIVVLLISLIANQRYSYNKNISVKPVNESVDFFTNYSFKKYELVKDKESRFFSGYMSREEVDRNMAEVLDFIYQKADKDSGKLDIEVDIKRLIRQEVE